MGGPLQYLNSGGFPTAVSSGAPNTAQSPIPQQSQQPKQPPTGQAPPPFATMTPGNSPAYGTQSPTMFGTGTYTAPLLPINDQAITGAPSQGAGTNYGINSVWDNLNKELAAAPKQGAGMATASTGGPASYQAATGQAAQAQAAQGGYATAGNVGLGVGGNTIANQAALAHTLDVQANGGGVSAADLQLQQGTQQGLAAQLAALGSQRGNTNAALAQRAAQDQAAAGNATLNQQMGIQRAQETQAAQQAEGSVLGAQGAQAAGINSTAASLQQQTELANAANAQQSTLANTENAQQAGLTNAAAINAMTGQNLSAVNAANTGNAQLSQAQNLANLGYSNQDTLANQQTQLANLQLQDNQTNAVLGAQTGIGQANRAASLADQQLQLQQMIAANQVNEQGYQASANANGNLTGAIVGAGGALLSTGLNAALKSGSSSSAGSGGDITTFVPSSADSATAPLNLFGNSTTSASTWRPNTTTAISDENLKTGIEGGNPMMRSFLQNYSAATAPEPKVNVTEGSNFRNPTYGRAPSTGGSSGGGGIGSTIGSVLGGIAGSFVAPGAGTALGAAAGGAVGGAIGSGIDPATGGTGGGMMMTSPGSGVTVDESGWDQMPTGMPTGASALRPPAPGVALSDENEKDAVTSGNRGMQAFLQQANQQTGAQNNSGAQSNAFMQTGGPPSSQVDTQLPHYGQPPFMQHAQGGVGYGMPSAATGGTVSGGGITNYGGYQGASMNPWGGVAAPMGSGLSLQYDTPVDPAQQQALASAHQYMMPQAGDVPSPTHPATLTPTNSQTASNFQSPSSAIPPFAFFKPTQLPSTAWTMSDENEKVKSTDTGNVQNMLDQLAPYSFRYKDPSMPGAMPGQRLGIMAQDLEQSRLGKQFVRETPDGTKMVDFGSMAGTQLAASAHLSQRLDSHEKMLKQLMGSR